MREDDPEGKKGNPVIATSSYKGLSEDEAERRLREEGFNELESSKRGRALAIALRVLGEPMILLLLGAGALYFLLGERREALVLLGFVVVIIGIDFFQEHRTERALRALRELSSPRAQVIREGKVIRVAGREVARGDLLVLEEGDRVPADAVLLECSHFYVDESLLTGESMPVRKSPYDSIPGEMGRPGGEGQPFVFSGTLAVRGHGIAEVLATGPRTEMGRIGASLQEESPGRTLLQREIGRMVKRVAVAALLFCALVVVVYALTHGGEESPWLKGLLVGVALSMAMLPEEFPVVMAVFLALGAWRMSRRNVLVRNPAAVETLGSATVLCVDKTGTLTLNRLTATLLFAEGDYLDLGGEPERREKEESSPCYGEVVEGKKDIPEKFHRLVEFAVLASRRHTADPVEKALLELGEEYLSDTEHLHGDWVLEKEYPLAADLLALSHVWRSPDAQEFVIAAKGAPEAVADLCHFSEEERRALSVHVSSMAEEGLRVLGVASSCFTLSSLPSEQHDFDFHFLGLIGLEDPVRPGGSSALAECREAGIRVIMVTGDYPATAVEVARRAGLDISSGCLTGPELLSMDEGELKERAREVNIYARMTPPQKLRLVQALRGLGEVVAMTGDGVNDAPALKAANIGIAMGGRGTDVAREAADLVLLDDDLASITGAVRMGRRIFDNLRKAVSYIVAVHVPIAGMALIPVLFRQDLVLMPVHIAFLEMVIDPACSVVFEAEPPEEGIMRRLPRRSSELLFGGRMLLVSLAQGLSALAMVSLVFGLTHWRGLSPQEVRTTTFTALVLANLALILSNRSWNRGAFSGLQVRNPALWWVGGGTLIFLALALVVPFLRQIFGFSLPHPFGFALCLAAGGLSILGFEAFKLVVRRRGLSGT